MITPEEAERIARKAMALEEGIEVSVAASRPPGLRLPELALEHEHRQRRLRGLAIGTNLGALASLALAMIGGGVAAVGAAIAFVSAGLVLVVFAARAGRAFESKVREAAPRTRAPL